MKTTVLDSKSAPTNTFNSAFMSPVNRINTNDFELYCFLLWGCPQEKERVPKTWKGWFPFPLSCSHRHNLLCLSSTNGRRGEDLGLSDDGLHLYSTALFLLPEESKGCYNFYTEGLFHPLLNFQPPLEKHAVTKYRMQVCWLPGV